MRWRVILGTGALVLISLTIGCGSEKSDRLVYDKTMLNTIAQAGMGPATPLSRAQKPETGHTTSWDNRPLDAEPERPPDLVGVVPSARIRCTVNGQAILEQEVRTTALPAIMALHSMRLPEKEEQQKEREILNTVCEQLIDRELIIQDMENKLSASKQGQKALEKIREAASNEFQDHQVKDMMKRTNSNSLEELKVKLREFGMPYEMYKRQSERQFISLEFSKHTIFPTITKYTSHPYILEYYESHPDEFMASDMVDWQDIFIAAGRHPSRAAARRFAEVLAQRARTGEDFAKLAEQFDNGDSSLRDNALGIGQKRGEIRPAEAEPILFKMREGDVGVVEISTGYHVVRCLKRTQAGLKPFDEKVQKDILNKLRPEIFQRELKRLVTDLRRKAIIERSDSH